MAKKSRNIPEVLIPDAKTLQFSFKHLECDHPEFSLSGCKDEFWKACFVELKNYSAWTTDQFLNHDHEVARHPVVFSDTTEFDGLGIDLDFVEWSDIWQFGVGERRHGWRAIGVIVSDIFYLRWIDHRHKLYSMTKADAARRNNERTLMGRPSKG